MDHFVDPEIVGRFLGYVGRSQWYPTQEQQYGQASGNGPRATTSVYRGPYQSAQNRPITLQQVCGGLVILDSVCQATMG